MLTDEHLVCKCNVLLIMNNAYADDRDIGLAQSSVQLCCVSVLDLYTTDTNAMVASKKQDRVKQLMPIAVAK